MPACVYPFKKIREYYDKRRDAILSANSRQWGCPVYGMDWISMFSPIEHIAWGEIRHLGLILYPQYPIAEMFVDFASPQQKVVIECDGAAYHNKDQDAERDERLRKRGWTVYRIPGKDFMRHELNIDDFLYELEQACADDGGDSDGISSRQLIAATKELVAGSYSGVFLAIAHVHFGKDLLPESMSSFLFSVAEKYRTVTGETSNGSNSVD